LVAEPVRLHVQAKRYLVKRNPHYLDRLSDDSRRSLALQGGAMSDAECAAFECSPHHKPALLLRVCACSASCIRFVSCVSCAC
jgi:predicted HD phosphohydrolase